MSASNNNNSNSNPNPNANNNQSSNIPNPHNNHNIIQQTRQIVQNMSQQQRFKKAKRHLMDAIQNRHPRNDFETNQSKSFKRIYTIQTSGPWSYTLFLLGFVYMYLIVGQPTNRQHINQQFRPGIVTLEILILFLYWIDIAMEIYHKFNWPAQRSVKYPILFQVKVLLISAMTIDALVYYPLYKKYPVRLFRILRPFIPFLYNRFARRALQSFGSIYKDIICYTVFYFAIIFAFGIIGTQLINLPPGVHYDWYNQNYENVGQTSFMFYILASFDSWPDYWQLAIDQSKWHYTFLVAFIFLNYFYFVTIPTSVMFNSFKKTRSALLLIDQIHQQNSLLLCFICLGEDNLCIQLQTFHQFMLYAYLNKLRLIDHIKQISFRLGVHHNKQIFISDFMKICKIIQQEPQMCPPRFHDWEPYIKFRNFLKDRLKLKKIIQSKAFNIGVILLTLINLVIIIVSIPVKKLNNFIVEYLFVGLFLLQILMRLIGTGIEKFTSQLGNSLELGLACFYILLLCFDPLIDDSVLIQLLALLRLFRIPRIFNIMLINNYFKRFYYNNTLFKKIRIVFQDLFVSVAIGIKMFPLFMTLYYILGIIGIQAYDETFLLQKTSPYSVYDKVANFRTFLFSQIVIVQSMIEAGWSMIIFDHAVRFGNTALVYIYFIMIHIFIDTTIFSLMKGMVADLYETISLQFEALDRLQAQQLEDEKEQQKKKDEIAEIRKILQEGVELGYDSLKKKQIYENKLDRQMMQSLKVALNKKSVKSFKRFKTLRSVIFAKSAEEIIKQQRDQIKIDSKIDTKLDTKQSRLDRDRTGSPNMRKTRRDKTIRLSIDCIQQKQQQQIQQIKTSKINKKPSIQMQKLPEIIQINNSKFNSKSKQKKRQRDKESIILQQQQQRPMNKSINDKYKDIKSSKKKRQKSKQKQKQKMGYQKVNVLTIQQDMDQQIHIKTSLETQQKLKQISKEDQEQQQLDSDSSMSIGDSDIQEIEDNLLDRIILKQQQIPYAQAPVYPKFLLEFLGRKLIIANQKIQKQGAFNPNTMGIRSKNSLSFYTNILQLLLQIKKTQFQRKNQIAEDILKLRMPNSNPQQIDKNLSKRSVEKQVLIAPIIRKIMLSNISQQFMKKFQIQYFSGVYGNSFRQINRTTLDPLLRHQSFMLYNFQRALRYPPPDNQIFWNILATIQDNVSRTLLHDGSIFTFVFEVEELAGNWFAIEVRQNMQIKVHFLKTGIWVYHRGMKYDDIYYGQDIFHCNEQELQANQNAEKTIKLLYNAFETLGFSMLNETDFFDSDPARHSYDLYSFVLNCQDTKRLTQQQSKKYGNSLTVDSQNQKPKQYNLKITKMMGVILSKQTQRPAGKQLKYELTSLKKILEQRLQKRKQKIFRFDQDEAKTYEKLQNLAQQQYQRLIYSQSLEYAFIVDAIESVRDSCKSYLDNLISQAELVINTQFSKVHSNNK